MFPKGPAEGFIFSLSEFIYFVMYLLLLSKEDKFKAPTEEKADRSYIFTLSLRSYPAHLDGVWAEKQKFGSV